MAQSPYAAGHTPVIEQARLAVRDRQARLVARFAWIATAREALLVDRRIAGSLLAAGVAFRLFLMMLPLSLLIAALLGFVSSGAGDQAPAQAARQFGLTFAIARVISDSTKEADRSRWVLLALGLVLLLWTGNGVVTAFNNAFRFAWRMPPSRTMSVRTTAVTVLGLTLAVAATILAGAIGTRSPALELVLSSGLAIAYFLAWLWISARLPHRSTAWSTLVPGAALFAIGLVALHLATVLFVANRVERATQLYGSLGLISTLMLWLFLIGRIVVASAQLNATLWRGARKGAEGPPEVDIG